jgi:XTP/dITP diphosphohydrolase
MYEIVFATNNAHKMSEVSSILGPNVHLISLREIGCKDDLPETQLTLQGNALQKARYVWEKFGVNCVADDTGLEVDGLGGAPGVYSARYAGPECIAENNIQKLLKAMKGMEQRTARFRTVAALILEGKEYLFEGKVEGEILTQKMGLDGFGYDPVFKPSGFSLSFAEMPFDVKNSISHRARAFQAFAEFLKDRL